MAKIHIPYGETSIFKLRILENLKLSFVQNSPISIDCMFNTSETIQFVIQFITLSCSVSVKKDGPKEKDTLEVWETETGNCVKGFCIKKRENRYY